MIVKALDNGKFCVWNGFAHKPVDDKQFDTLAQAEQHLETIGNNDD